MKVNKRTYALWKKYCDGELRLYIDNVNTDDLSNWLQVYTKEGKRWLISYHHKNLLETACYLIVTIQNDVDEYTSYDYEFATLFECICKKYSIDKNVHRLEHISKEIQHVNQMEQDEWNAFVECIIYMILKGLFWTFVTIGLLVLCTIVVTEGSMAVIVGYIVLRTVWNIVE